MLAAGEFEAMFAAAVSTTVVADSMSRWMVLGEEDWSATMVDGHALY